MKTYRVIAPFAVFSIKDGTGKTTEYSQKKGDTLQLPESNITVRALVARGQIAEVSPAKRGKVEPPETA
jgi:hypothetical protein